MNHWLRGNGILKLHVCSLYRGCSTSRRAQNCNPTPTNATPPLLHPPRALSTPEPGFMGESIGTS
jgi:hypothetical protein